MKQKPLIACRPDAELAQDFFVTITELGCTMSEFAKLALKEGLPIAKRKHIEGKKEEARKILDRYKDDDSTARLYRHRRLAVAA